MRTHVEHQLLQYHVGEHHSNWGEGTSSWDLDSNPEEIGKFPLGLVHHKRPPQVPNKSMFSLHFIKDFGTCGGLFWGTNPSGKLREELNWFSSSRMVFLQSKIQLRIEFTIFTSRNFCSCGRCLGSTRNSCSTCWKSSGVSRCFLLSSRFESTLNQASTSSWECPLWRKRSSIRFSRRLPIKYPAILVKVLFFTSREVLSAWQISSIFLMSDVSDIWLTT